MFERLWRCLKYEAVYLKEYPSVSDYRRAIGEYFENYNYDRLHLKRQTVFQVVVGLSRGWWTFSLFCMAFGYNVLRIYLTYQVGLMRDREDQTGLSPALKEYQPLVYAHLFAGVLVLMVFFFYIQEIVYWMRMPIVWPV